MFFKTKNYENQKVDPKRIICLHEKMIENKVYFFFFKLSFGSYFETNHYWEFSKIIIFGKTLNFW